MIVRMLHVLLVLGLIASCKSHSDGARTKEVVLGEPQPVDGQGETPAAAANYEITVASNVVTLKRPIDGVEGNNGQPTYQVLTTADLRFLAAEVLAQRLATISIQGDNDKEHVLKVSWSFRNLKGCEKPIKPSSGEMRGPGSSVGGPQGTSSGFGLVDGGPDESKVLSASAICKRAAILDTALRVEFSSDERTEKMREEVEAVFLTKLDKESVRDRLQLTLDVLLKRLQQKGLL